MLNEYIIYIVYKFFNVPRERNKVKIMAQEKSFVMSTAQTKLWKSKNKCHGTAYSDYFVLSIFLYEGETWILLTDVEKNICHSILSAL